MKDLKMSAEQRVINWTERARLQLVEAVIKVEKEAMIDASQKASGGSAGQKTGSKMEKWKAITKLLPVELRAMTCSRKRQSNNTPKCYSFFHNLVKAYRDKVEGKGNLGNLTEPVCRLLKRREDLLNRIGSVPLERRLIPGSSKRVNASNLISGRVGRRLSERVANSVQGQSYSSVREDGEARETELQRPVEAQNFDSNAGKEQRTDLARVKSEGNATIIHWTETGCLQVIEAVRQVEEETRNKCNIPIQSSTGRPMTKWKRVEVLLPPTLRGRTWNFQRERYNKYKCERLFDTVLKAYRDNMKRTNRKARMHSMLTEPVCDLLKRLVSARSSVATENSLKSGSSYRVSTRTCSANDQEDLLATGHNSLNAYPDEGFSTEWRSSGTAIEQGVSFILDHTKESSEKAPHSDKKMEPNQIAHEKSTERNKADSSLGCPSSPLVLAYHSHNPNKPPSSTREFTSTSGSESKDCKQMATPSDRPAVQTGASIQSQSRHLTRLCLRASSLVRKSSTTLTTHTTYDERTLDLRRLDLEFSHLSSWLQSQSVPIGTKLMNEMTSSAIISSKRRKLNYLGASDDSFNRYMDFRIGAAFEKVRTRIAEELKNTCAELTRDLHQGRLTSQFSQPKSWCEQTSAKSV